MTAQKIFELAKKAVFLYEKQDRPNSGSCSKRCYRTARSTEEVFARLTLRPSTSSQKGTKLEIGWERGIELAEGRCGNGGPGCPSSRIGPSPSPGGEIEPSIPEQGVGQSQRWAHLVRASCVHGREVPAHLEAAPADAVRARTSLKGELYLGRDHVYQASRPLSFSLQILRVSFASRIVDLAAVDSGGGVLVRHWDNRAHTLRA